jgi:hypothetical protein
MERSGRPIKVTTALYLLNLESGHLKYGPAPSSNDRQLYQCPQLTIAYLINYCPKGHDEIKLQERPLSFNRWVIL